MPKRRRSARSRASRRGSYRREYSSSSDDANYTRRSQQQESRAQSANESLNKFTDAIKSLIATTNTRPPSMAFKGETVPCFDPEDTNQSVETWLKKVDELQNVYEWSEEATIYFALSKLRGMAELWYKGLDTLKYSWEEWKKKLLEAFPYKKEYIDLIIEMVRRKKRTDETYTKYYYEKITLLNACGITGTNAVSCLIGGIEDTMVKTGAKAGQHKSPESLLQYLSAFNTAVPTSSHLQNKYSRQKEAPIKRYRKFQNQNPNQKTTQNATCYICGKPGHFANKCSEKLEKTCKVCGKKGHEETRCFKNNKTSNKPVA